MDIIELYFVYAVILSLALLVVINFGGEDDSR